MSLHYLKLSDKYFDAVKNGVKTFEIRKDDRGYRVGDTLVLQWIGSEEQMMKLALNEQDPPTITRYISYILTHDDFPNGLKEGYVILGLRRVQRWTISSRS